MAEINDRYLEKLLELADTKYRDFMASLIPGVDNIIGVRSPQLRKLAKELSKDNWLEYFDNNQDKYYEETMLQGMTIGLLDEDIETVLSQAQRFIPKITNWALCDSFCSGLKITKKNKECVWEFVKSYVNSDKTYEIRFAVVMMLNYYVDVDYIQESLEIFESINNEDYYVKMAVAWAVSKYYVNLPEMVLPFLKNNKLDDFTHNKALQKIRESLIPSAEEKALMLSLKRKIG